MNTIFTRRSVRAYKDTPVEQEKLIQILKAGMQAPSAQNQQGWEFIVVTDKETLAKMSQAAPGARMTADAAFSIVVLANSDVIASKAPTKWEQDLGACTQNIMLEAVNQGLGTVWIGIATNEDRMKYLSDLFQLPSNLMPFNMITGGYPLLDDANKFVDRFDESKIHFEKF